MKNELRVDNAPVEITYKAIVDSPAATKASGNAKFHEDNKFRSYAYLTTGGAGWSTAYENAQPWIYNELISYYSQEWKAATAHYWPKDPGSSLTFFSWTVNTTDNPADVLSPLVVSCTPAAGIVVNDYSIIKNKNIDFMTAYTADQKENKAVSGAPSRPWNYGVPTVFEHALSRFSFKANLKETYANTSFTLQQIAFRSVAFQGDYQQKNASDWTKSHYWTAKNGYADFPMWRRSTSEVVVGKVSPEYMDLNDAANVDYTLMLPQTFADETAQMEIMYFVKTQAPGAGGVDITDYVTTSVPMKTVFPSGWEAGKEYVCQLSLGFEKISWDPVVMDWVIEATVTITFAHNE